MQKYQVFFKKTQDISRFVAILNQFECDIDLKKGSVIMDAKSLMAVMAMSEADNLELIIHDTDCEKILSQITPFIVKEKSA